MSTPRPLGACIRHGYGNSIHEKQDDCVNWFPVGEGVAAPLEPTKLTSKDFYEQKYDGDVECILLQLFPHRIEEIWKFAEAYAAAVSKNLQEELRLAELEKRIESGKLLQSMARNIELEKEITALELRRKEDAEWINKISQDEAKSFASRCLAIMAYSAGMLLRGEITALRETK